MCVAPHRVVHISSFSHTSQLLLSPHIHSLPRLISYFNMPDGIVLEPKDKSDSKWLRDAGYSGGIKQFMITFGLKFPNEIDEGKRLIDGFRKEQQQEWEAKNSNVMLKV